MIAYFLSTQNTLAWLLKNFLIGTNMLDISKNLNKNLFLLLKKIVPNYRIRLNVKKFSKYYVTYFFK